MVKQALNLTDLIQEGTPLQASYDNQGKRSIVGGRWRRRQQEIATVASEEKPIDCILQFSLQEIPQKNTFIHYDLRAERPPTPTSSAPGVLLSRLFKTKDQSDAKMQSDEPSIGRLPSTDSDVSLLTGDLTPKKGDFENDSQVSTSESNPASPPEVNLASAEELPLNVQLVNEMHQLGQCVPCNYHWNKKDGCRQGSTCDFCHLCPKGEVKKRKKDKVRELRKAAGRRRWAHSASS